MPRDRDGSRSDNRDDREKPSWRDRDKRNDARGHRDGGASEGAPRSNVRPHEYNAYKANLDKLFDGDPALSAVIKARLEDADVAPTARNKKALGQEIVAAENNAAVMVALRAFEAAHGFPDDEEVLAKLLDAEDEDVVVRAMNTVGVLLDAGPLKRATSLRARIKAAQVRMDDGDVDEAARQVLARL